MQNIAQFFTQDYWFTLSTMKQLAFIGHRVGFAIDWRKKGDVVQVDDEIEKALQLLELTIIDPKNVKRLSEIVKLKEALIDDFRGNNEFKSIDQAWREYFAFFEHLVKTNNER
jgi:hypothetical protein